MPRRLWKNQRHSAWYRPIAGDNFEAGTRQLYSWSVSTSPPTKLFIGAGGSSINAKIAAHIERGF